jgi:hypothetical protein
MWLISYEPLLLIFLSIALFAFPSEQDCLTRVDSRSSLVSALKASNTTRLLHPGAETTDIISQYVSTIRCLRIVDPPGVLLQKVSEPIRRFLKNNRPDTIRCIVSALVNPSSEEGEGGLELDEEDGEGGVKAVEETDEREEDYSDPNWVPEPVDAAPGSVLFYLSSPFVSSWRGADSVIRDPLDEQSSDPARRVISSRPSSVSTTLERLSSRSYKSCSPRSCSPSRSTISSKRSVFSSFHPCLASIADQVLFFLVLMLCSYVIDRSEPSRSSSSASVKPPSRSAKSCSRIWQTRSESTCTSNLSPTYALHFISATPLLLFLRCSPDVDAASTCVSMV